MMQSVKVFAPATVANVACGFDVLGFAVGAPGDVVTLTRRTDSRVVITGISGDDGRLPREVELNTAGVAVQLFLQHINETTGVDIFIEKQMPLGSGMGSSAASAVAGVVAANELFGKPLSREQLLPFAMEGERLACGSAHADNAAPSLLGGFVLIRSYEPLDVIKVPTPQNLFCALVHPHIEIQTRDAREVLPRHVRMKDAITQWGNLGGMLAGLMMNDMALIARSLEDVIVEPVRSLLIPGFHQVKEAALQAGALGCSISGSGPSLFALFDDEASARAGVQKMAAAFKASGIDSEYYVSRVNLQGATVV